MRLSEVCESDVKEIFFRLQRTLTNSIGHAPTVVKRAGNQKKKNRSCGPVTFFFFFLLLNFRFRSKFGARQPTATLPDIVGGVDFFHVTLAAPSARRQSSGKVAVVAVRYESARPYCTDGHVIFVPTFVGGFRRQALGKRGRQVQAKREQKIKHRKEKKNVEKTKQNQ
jgi:hypothetical protein